MAFQSGLAGGAGALDMLGTGSVEQLIGADGVEAPKKKKPASGVGAIEGLAEALSEAFAAASVSDTEPDMDGLIQSLEKAAYKQSKKFYNDERYNQKMSAAECNAFMGEFIETVMTAFYNTLYEKPWIEKVSWHGPLLMIAFHTFGQGRVYSRVMKTEIPSIIEEGLLAHTEEHRVKKEVWNALESVGIAEAHKLKIFDLCMKAYDEAYWHSPYGTAVNDNAEVATAMDFIKGWMSGWVEKAHLGLGVALKDGSSPGLVAALTQVFQHIFDPNVAACPVSIQNSLMPAPWSYIQDCAAECVAEMEEKAPKRMKLA